MSPEPAPPARWQLIRDVAVFQVKLGVDALRDLVLSPVSLVAAVLDLVTGDRPRPYFYEVLAAGRRSEAWIDLFGAAERVDPGRPAHGPEDAGIDALMRRVEEVLAHQVERGGVTAHAKEAIDRRLDALVERRIRPREPAD